MGKRILIIERSRTIRTLLSTYFGNAGHHVDVYSTMQGALEGIAGPHDTPDLLFLAIYAHEKEGCKLFHTLKKQPKYAHTALVAMVLQEDMAQVQQVLRDIRVSYLVKPFQIQDALALVSDPVVAGSSATRTEGEERI